MASFPGSRSSRQAVTFTSGDLKYLNYDTEDMALKVMAPLYSQIVSSGLLGLLNAKYITVTSLWAR